MAEGSNVPLILGGIGIVAVGYLLLKPKVAPPPSTKDAINSAIGAGLKDVTNTVGGFLRTDAKIVSAVVSAPTHLPSLLSHGVSDLFGSTSTGFGAGLQSAFGGKTYPPPSTSVPNTMPTTPAKALQNTSPNPFAFHRGVAPGQ